MLVVISVVAALLLLLSYYSSLTMDDLHSSSSSSSITTTTTIHHHQHYSPRRNRSSNNNNSYSHAFLTTLKRLALGFTLGTSSSLLQYELRRQRFPHRAITRLDHSPAVVKACSLVGIQRGTLFALNDYFYERYTDNAFLAAGSSAVVIYCILQPINMFLLEELFNEKRDLTKLFLQRGEFTRRYFPQFRFTVLNNFLHWSIFLGGFDFINRALNPYNDVVAGGMKEFAEAFVAAEAARIIAVICGAPVVRMRNVMWLFERNKSSFDEKSALGKVKNVREMTMLMYRQDGVRGFFRSVPRNIAGGMAVFGSVVLASYDRAKVGLMIQSQGR